MAHLHSNRHWYCLQFRLYPHHLDLASVIVAEMGTQGIEEYSLESGQVQLKAYFEPTQDLRRLANHFKLQCQRAAISLSHYSVKVEREKDWLRKWRQYLKPFLVGKRFLIHPNQCRQNLKHKGRISIWLEPRMAFGTGTHETTQLCLEAIEELRFPGKSVLDVGTGSGILAIACAKLGASQVIACDIDSNAIKIADINCRRNQIDSKVSLILGGIESIKRKRFDLILANLDGKLFRQNLLSFGCYLKPNGLMIISGMLRQECIEICQQHETQTLRIFGRRNKGEWSCLVLGENLEKIPGQAPVNF